jgi:hypothetical protein
MFGMVREAMRMIRN